MDHLRTEQERKDRWYAKHVVPEYVAVQSVTIDEIRRAAASPARAGHADGRGSTGPPLSPRAVFGMPSSVLSAHEDEAPQYLARHLEQHGFAVIQGVLQESECDHALSLAWDYVEAASLAEQRFQESQSAPAQQGAAARSPNRDVSVATGGCSSTRTPVRREEPDTYTSACFPRSVEGRMFPFYGAGHSSFMWYLRSHPAVLRVFAALHSVEGSPPPRGLATSLDGFVLWTDMDAKGGDELDRGWFHIDQSPEKKPTFASYQGLVNLLPVTPRTGGNVLVAGSHRLFPHHYLEGARGDGGAQDGDPAGSGPLFYRERLKELDGDDWLEIDPGDDELLKSGRVITCLLGPGDVLIWDSRTVHCSYRETVRRGRTLQQDEEDEHVAVDTDHSVAQAHRSCRARVEHGHAPRQDVGDDAEGERAAPGSPGRVRAEHSAARTMASQHGLIRAAGMVNMVPRADVPDLACRGRLDAVSRSRTLTHWVGKVSPLAEERDEEVQKEACRVGYMKEGSVGAKKRKVLLSYEDLSDAERSLL